MRTFGQLVGSIETIPRKQSTLLIGVDGCGGAGKSSLANKLKELKPNVTVVHMDDFYLPSSQIIKLPPKAKPIGADVDWGRVLKQVLEPLSKNQEGNYQRYDWEKDTLAEWHAVPIGGIVIVEGVYSTRRELASFYDYTIWVDSPRKIRLERGLERDGEAARDRWVNDWMVAEDIYVEEHTPSERADLVILGIS
ncbi:uridine kinase family protein [Bacillus sp. EB01]|uniref:uridine kinase family protein n=1 Tax=Bacillus sp. EB01 TaxID=1347086 RepID=UPI0005C6AE34|nr:uridine kinase [Bacillus sp. EB01]